MFPADPVLTHVQPGTYGAHVYINATPASTVCPVTDIENNVGVYVKAILAKPEVSLPAKCVAGYTDQPTFGEILESWKAATGGPHFI